jgi:5-methylcytosine-specific restriction endonuclease McrA
MTDDDALHLPRAARLAHALRRDGERCVWCARALPVGHRDASLEHVVPRLKGGPAWPENEVAACRSCNRRRGHTAPLAYLDDCEARGLRPARGLVAERLRALHAAIQRRGGQRRARPYLEAQLRRI